MNATYKNKVTGETYKLGIQIEEDEAPLAVAWSRGIRVAATMNGWNLHDITVSKVN